MLFTVFTATYNRAHSLGIVFESLCKQSFTDFEWLVIDDGSSDNTISLLKDFESNKKINMRYLSHENQGKHRTFNKGVSLAQGEFFISLDSDDSVLPNALDTFAKYVKDLPSGFCGVTARCVGPDLKKLGGDWPSHIIDSNSWDMRFKLRLSGERFGCLRTSVLKEFPFPEIDGEKFIAESYIWLRMAQKYKTRYVDEGIRIYEPGAGGLSRSFDKLRKLNPKGMALYYGFMIEHGAPLKEQIKAAINFVRSRLLSRDKSLSLLKYRPNPLVFVAGYVMGFLYFLKDKGRV